MEHIGTRIKALRRQRDMTQEKLAEDTSIETFTPHRLLSTSKSTPRQSISSKIGAETIAVNAAHKPRPMP